MDGEGGRRGSDRELIPEDARSIRDAVWRMAELAQDAAEALDAMIEDEALDGRAEAVELRVALERVQAISLKVSEELDAIRTSIAARGRGWQELRPTGLHAHSPF